MACSRQSAHRVTRPSARLARKTRTSGQPVRSVRVACCPFSSHPHHPSVPVTTRRTSTLRSNLPAWFPQHIPPSATYYGESPSRRTTKHRHQAGSAESEQSRGNSLQMPKPPRVTSLRAAETSDYLLGGSDELPVAEVRTRVCSCGTDPESYPVAGNPDSYQEMHKTPRGYFIV